MNKTEELIMKTNQELMNEIKEQCGDCKAWSGTDCTRNPYTQGCLKDELKQYKVQAVKEFAEKLKKRLNLGLYEWQSAKLDLKTIDELLKEYEK